MSNRTMTHGRIRRRFLLSGVVAGLAVCMFWYLLKSVPAAFEVSIARQAALLSLNVEMSPWTVNWRRGILSTNNVTVLSADGSSPMLEIPLVEVDFHPWRTLSGWRAAVYQVYLHRPTVHLLEDAEGEWNWQRWARHASVHSIEAGMEEGFVLDRLYADVVGVQFSTRDGEFSLDNGVVTVTHMQLPPASAGAQTTVAAHFRADGGKLSVVGEGNAFAMRNGEWLPDVALTIQQQGVGPSVAEPLRLPATGTQAFTTDR